VKKHIVIKGKKINYSDTGTGVPVVLVHGYLETSKIWESYSKKLSEQYRVITIDLPGHGDSELPENGDSLEFIASVIKDIIDSLKSGKVILAGHSLGGYITLAFLDLYPEKLNGYCLFHSQPLSDTPESKEKRDKEIKLVSEGKRDSFISDNIRRLFATFNLEKMQDSVQRSINIASDVSSEGIIAVLNAMKARPSRVKVMEAGKVPGLWILGRYDNLIPCDTVQQKVTAPANLKVTVLEKSGHLGFIEEENLSLKVLSEFITGLRN
jgi:pimeloyl-ACP methyl ester carboxylesterase